MRVARDRWSYGIIAGPMMKRISTAALLGLLAAAACGDGTLENTPSTTDDDGGGGSGGDDNAGPDEPGPGDAAGSNPNTRLVRLTHSQYANTVRALFGVEETPE